MEPTSASVDSSASFALPSSAALSPIAYEMQALQHPHSVILTPPYPGIYLRSDGDDSNPYFDSAYRHFQQRGEVVAQLWTEKPTQTTRVGRIECGLRCDFKALHTGRHLAIVKADAGPITRIQATSTYLRSFIPGRGGNYGSVASHRTSYVTYQVDLVKGQSYSVFAIGGVLIVHRAHRPPAYGEVIVTFPQISLISAVNGFSTSDVFADDLDQALQSHDTPAEAAASLNATMDVGTLIMD